MRLIRGAKRFTDIKVGVPMLQKRIVKCNDHSCDKAPYSNNDMISFAPPGGSLNRPRLGFCFPAKTLSAVDFPIPLVPTKPRTTPETLLNDESTAICLLSKSK